MNSLPSTFLLEAMVKTPSVSAFLENAVRPEAGDIEVEGPEGAASAALIALVPYGGVSLAVVPTDREAAELACDLEALGLEPAVFPWWGTLPYREASPLSAVFGERTGVLAALLGGARAAETPGAGGPEPSQTAGRLRGRESGIRPGKRPPSISSVIMPKSIIVVPERAFLTPLPPPDYFRGLLITLRAGDAIDTRALAGTLIEYGYTRAPRVQLHGEFALRGEVLDVFSGGTEAYRILFDFDRVESVKRFDPLDQAPCFGTANQDFCVIRPLKEVIWTDERIAALADRLDECPEFSKEGAGRIIDELIERRSLPGEELFFPLAFTQTAVVADYLEAGSADSGMVFYLDRERLCNAQSALEQEYQGMYRAAKRELPLPSRILLDFAAAAGRGGRSVSFMSIHGGEKRSMIPCDPPRSFFGNIDYLKEEFASLLRQGWTIAVAAESEIQAGRVGEILRLGKEDGLPEDRVKMLVSPLSAGFSLPEAKLALVQEREIFGRRKPPPRSLGKVRSDPIDTFVELNPGDFVVHLQYGIGLFKGIERIRALGHERDYVKLEYHDGETVFVPIEQVNLVQRYIGNEGAPPRLDKLGSKSWENRKNRVRASVEDIARRLISLYSKRKTARGFAFPRESEWQTLFEAAFPFEETEDQLRCVEEIKADMESPHPMDRLVCGDVGYGKTEVAVRACFKAVMGGKQAAFLAPTTILAEQHYDNFRERFERFPVRIAMLSRFAGPAEARRILESVKKGETDLLVGTHRIIQKDIVFKDLGLLVIDEEQRFGVKDKEKLKELKTNVDCLTLSATPIPRTLHMSLLKIRDMSLLATPPRNRQPIETVIGEFDQDRIAAAIREEVSRGGQVFFLHNRIESLRETRMMLERITPEMLVETAHGQMESRDLEDVMRRFVHGGFHILVSTTIIENGIDIPNVNTIIIDRADMYGVSQLYQLRGRVGRSDRAARAFLLYPAERALSELAMKRLQVISDFTELGSGFKIAMKDMELRGAGNLLGREQSGDMYSVGFDLYLKLLDEAVRRLEDEQYEGDAETLLELEYSGFIPDSWIEEAQEKMEVYKKIAGVRTREELDGLYAGLAARYGPPPDEAASLLALAEIRVICREIAVASLREKAGLVRVEFGKVSRINLDRLVRLIKESPERVKLDSKQPNILLLKTGSIGLREKSEFIREKLAALAG